MDKRNEFRNILSNLTAGTKQEVLKWAPCSPGQLAKLQEGAEQVEYGFFVEYKGRFFVLYVYSHMESPDGDVFYKGQYPAIAITDLNLVRHTEWNSRDDVHVPEVWRLIKLVQRQAHKVDDFIQEFLADDQFEEGDPFA